MEFMSQEWMSQRYKLGSIGQWLPEMDARIQHVVTDCPDGNEVRYYDEIVGGALVGCGLGDIERPDVTITNLWADELAVMRGDVDMFDVLLAGRVDVGGDHGRLFLLVPTLMSPRFANFARALVADVA
jgi:hypothetical protein